MAHYTKLSAQINGGSNFPDLSSIARDGTRPPTAAIPFNNENLTGVNLLTFSKLTSRTAGALSSNTINLADGDSIGIELTSVPGDVSLSSFVGVGLLVSNLSSPANTSLLIVDGNIILYDFAGGAASNKYIVFDQTDATYDQNWIIGITANSNSYSIIANDPIDLVALNLDASSGSTVATFGGSAAAILLGTTSSTEKIFVNGTGDLSINAGTVMRFRRNGVEQLELSTTGVYIGSALVFDDATNDIGISSTTRLRPRDIYQSRDLYLGGTVGGSNTSTSKIYFGSQSTASCALSTAASSDPAQTLSIKTQQAVVTEIVVQSKTLKVLINGVEYKLLLG